MARELTTVDDDLGIEISDMMLVVMMVIVASTMAGVALLLTQQQAQAYTGLTDSRTLNATSTTQWINLISDPPYSPWISASFHNDGPNSAFIGINNPDELHELASGEDYQVNMAGGERRIELVFWKSNAGETASVRVIGKY
jgi:archaellum component FlaG (FlaF/FlaG flagellin family)